MWQKKEEDYLQTQPWHPPPYLHSGRTYLWGDETYYWEEVEQLFDVENELMLNTTQ